MYLMRTSASTPEASALNISRMAAEPAVCWLAGSGGCRRIAGGGIAFGRGRQAHRDRTILRVKPRHGIRGEAHGTGFATPAKAPQEPEARESKLVGRAERDLGSCGPAGRLAIAARAVQACTV